MIWVGIEEETSTLLVNYGRLLAFHCDILWVLVDISFLSWDSQELKVRVPYQQKAPNCLSPSTDFPVPCSSILSEKEVVAKADWSSNKNRSMSLVLCVGAEMACTNNLNNVRGWGQWESAVAMLCTPASSLLESCF